MLKAKEMAMMNHDENQDNVIVACHSLCHCHMDCSNRTEFPGPPRQSNIIGTELETEMTMNATMVKMMEMGSTEERNGVSGDEQHTNFINNIKEMDESTETCCSIDGHEILVNVTAVPDGGGSIGMHRDRNIQRRAGRGTPFQLEIFRAQCNSLSRTPKREVQWAVRTRSFIPKGAMITEVVGEVMDVSIARERMLKESVKHYHSALKARFLPSECIDSPPMAEGNGYFRRMFQARGVCIDTSCFGNISRFVRETCEMCVDKDQRYVVNVSLKLIYSSHLEASVPRLGMIAGRNIKAGEELVFGHRPGMCMLRALPVPLMGIYRRHRPRYADGERKLSRSHRADGNSFHNVEESRTSLSHFFTSLSGMKNCSRDEEDKREQSGAGCGVGTVEERHKRADMVVDDENKDDRCANGEHSDDVDEGERGASNDEVEREKCGALMVIDDSVLKAFSSYQHRIVFV